MSVDAARAVPIGAQRSRRRSTATRGILALALAALAATPTLAAGARAHEPTPLAMVGPAAEAASAPHTRLESSSPADSDTLTMAPEEIRLEFSGRIEARVAMILSGEGDAWILDARRDSADARVALAAVPSMTRSGDYRLAYRVISADGHPIEEAIHFRVELPERTEPADGDAGAGSPSSRDAIAEAVSPEAAAGAIDLEGSLPLVASALRGTAGFSLLALAGLLLFLALPGADAGPAASQWASRLAAITPLLLVGHIVAWAAHAGGGPITDGETLAAMLATIPGRIELVRLIAAVLVFWALGLARRPTLALVFATAAVIASGALGHSAAMSPAIAIPAKAIHLAAVAVWLGGLVFLVTAARDPDAFRRAALTVSGLALAAVVAVVLTGLLQSLLFMESWRDLLSTRYGLLVVAKAAGLGVLVALGARNRYRLIPALDRAGDAPLRRSVGWEVAVMLVVLLVAGLLANVSPAEERGAATTAAIGVSPPEPADDR